MIANCKNKSRGLKILLGVLLAVNVIFSGSFVLGADEKSKQIFSPMELSYPNIPGLGRFSDYQFLDQPKQIGFIVSYIFKLVFFISIGAGLIALLVAGVLYIVSSSKPRYLILAKQMASNAMLGLFILLCAGLFLYVINPQLLNLTLEKPKLTPIPAGTANPYAPGTVVAQKVSVARDLNSAVDNLEEKVYLVLNSKNKETGQYAEQLKEDKIYCLTDGYGGAMKEDGVTYLRDLPKLPDGTEDPLKIKGCQPAISGTMGTDTFRTINTTNFVYRAEIPLRETAAALKIISPLVDSLKKSLEQCKCGMSLGYSDTSAGSSGCKPGLDPEDDDYLTNVNGQNFCLNQAEDCGAKLDSSGFLACDLRDVRKQGEVYQVCMEGDGIGKCTEKVDCWSNFIPGSKSSIVVKDSCVGRATAIEGNLIKAKVTQIQEQQAKMQARAHIDARFLDSITLIARALNANAIEFTTSQGIGLWSYGFDKKAEEIKQAGLDLVIQDAKDAGDTTAPTAPTAVNIKKNNSFFARLKSFFSPFVTSFALAQSGYVSDSAATFYYITHAPASIQAEDITAKNNAIARDARRYNLFSLLTDLPLEGIEAIFRDCLTAAFGVADYELDQDQIQDVIDAVMASGAGDHFKSVVQEMIDRQRIAEAAANGVGDAVVDDSRVAFIKPFLTKCVSAGVCEVGVDGIDITARDYSIKIFDKNDCPITAVLGGSSGSCCYCIKNLMSNGVPPNYLSKTFSAVFTTSLQDKLPEINKILETDLIEILFPQNDPKKPIGDFLNKPSKEIYDAIFKGALTQKFDTMIPGLDNLLEKQMQDVLPDFIVNQIVKINTWFEDTVSSTKSLAKSASNKMAEGLVDEYVRQPFAQWTANWWEERGVGAETIDGCFGKFEQGYVYKAKNGRTTETAFMEDITMQYWNDIETYCANVNKNVANNPKPKKPGKCFKMTPEEITDMYHNGKVISKSFNYDGFVDCGSGEESDLPVIKKKVNTFDVKENTQLAHIICENAGYDWDEISEKCLKIDRIDKDVQAALDVKNNLTKVKVEGALVNYAEKLTVAFTETALQFALAYARVFVEDNFIAPLMTYWNTISGFQKGMQNFLTTSVKGILPAQISGFLESNIVEQIDEFCVAYNTNGKKSLTCSKDFRDSDIAGECTRIDLRFTLPEGVEWKDSKNISGIVYVPKETGDAICKIDKALETTPWEEITLMCAKTVQSELEKGLCRVIDPLNKKLIDVLGDICVNVDGEKKCFDIDNWFDRPLFGMLFPKFDASWKDLIKATPKNLICGETTVFKAEQCAPIMKKGYGIIPMFEEDAKLDAKQKELKPWCAFVYSACKLPVEAKTTVGKFIKTIVEKSCNAYDDKSDCGDGKCYCKGCPEATSCTNDICRGCSFLGKNSIFYSLFKREIIDIDTSSLKDLLNGLGTDGPTLRTILNQNEVLGKTPYQAIFDYVCASNKTEGTDEYALCEILRKTPQELMGLDKPLKEFIRPKEFIILFDMLQNDLKDGSAADCQPNEFFNDEFFRRTGQGVCCADDEPTLCYKVGEKPVALKKLLDFMSEKDFVDVLSDLQQSMPANSIGTSEVFPIVATVDLTGYPNCLKQGTKISACSSIISNDLKARGLPLDKTITLADQNVDIFFEHEITVSKESVQGMVINTDNAVAVRYYFVKPMGTTNLILIYKEPNPEKVAFRTAISFMTMETGVVADKILGEQTIADYICDDIAMKVEYWPYPNGYESGIVSVCDVPLVENWLNWEDKGIKYIDKLKVILSSTPLDLVAKYLTKPLVFNASCRKKPVGGCKANEQLNIDGTMCCFESSFMDMVSANTALGQPLIDTLGALTGLDKIIKGEADSIFGKANKVFDWAEKGAKAGVGAIQNGLNNALYEWPKSMAPQWLAEFYGFNVGENTATDMAGACYSMPEKGCKLDKGEIEKDKGTPKAQCCILAKGESCQPRCREVDAKVKQCDVLSGEMAKPIDLDYQTRMCCFEQINTGQVDATTKEKIYQCKKSRAVNLSPGMGKCRTTNENGQAYETEEGSGADGRCVFKENFESTIDPELPANNPPKYITDYGYCCSTVGQCIANRFSSHLENLAEMLADGNIPLDHLNK